LDLRIIFMGTPDFAVPSLSILLQAGYNIAAVITAPDKAAGRGLQPSESAVKKYATAKNLKILQPLNLKDPLFVEDLRSLQADLQVVVAFRMLPEVVWNMPPLGTINLHASLLPQYRGAAPINWAIINGETETGVTTFKLKHEIDTGNILLQEKISVGEDETAGELHNRMKETGAALLLKTVKEISENPIIEIAQENIQSIHNTQHFGNTHHLNNAPKIFTETCRIDWNKQVHQVYNLIRGLSPHPGAFTILKGKTLKIYKAKKEMAAVINIVGEFETDNKSFLKFACSNGYISIIELQLEGKKKMTVEEFLRGRKLSSS
jgi:methionyl-tRNA formyltransferase